MKISKLFRKVQGSSSITLVLEEKLALAVYPDLCQTETLVRERITCGGRLALNVASECFTQRLIHLLLVQLDNVTTKCFNPVLPNALPMFFLSERDIT